MDKFTTNSSEETQNVGQNFARKILAAGIPKNAVVLALSGDLGAGKTTFLQGFAKGLGISEVVNSPTFVIQKRFKIPADAKDLAGGQDSRFGNFYHIDCYRLENPEEILQLGFKDIIADPKNIIAVEWPEKIAGILPKGTIFIGFKHLEENKREVGIRP